MSELGPDPLAEGEEHIAVDAARAALHAALKPIGETEVVGLAQAVGRVLAADLVSPIDVPAHDNSAMDGYAFHGAALQGGAGLQLAVVATVFAGHAMHTRVSAGECVRIMTGAVLPDGLDTVVPLELCRVDGERITVEPRKVQPGDNLRRRGEDLKAGAAALRAGRVLRPADIGLAASLGLTVLTVMRRLRVAVFSTGDEVVAPGGPLPENCIYDSNRFALIAALQRLGLQVIDLGLRADDPEALRDALRVAQVDADADVVVTSGGVSAGDADYTREVIARMGSVQFWKVAMRPGRPFAFGALHRDAAKPVWLFALPGNPVAALVAFHVFVRDALLALNGANPEPIPTLRARSASAIRKRPGRTEFQRGYVERAPQGHWEVRSVGPQGAGVLRSMSEANALIVLGHDEVSVAAGAEVEVWLFDGMV